MVTSIKNDIFLQVTTRTIAHSGRFECIPNCVGEFGMDTGQPLVTTNVMLNHLSYHHKAYYTYIEMYIQMYNAMCHITEYLTEFSSATKPIIFVIKRSVLVPGMCPCIRIRSMMHYVYTGEVVVTSIKIDIFLLVTTRPIAHSGRFVYIPNCVGEIGTDTR